MFFPVLQSDISDDHPKEITATKLVFVIWFKATKNLCSFNGRNHSFPGTEVRHVSTHFRIASLIAVEFQWISPCGIYYRYMREEFFFSRLKANCILRMQTSIRCVLFGSGTPGPIRHYSILIYWKKKTDPPSAMSGTSRCMDSTADVWPVPWYLIEGKPEMET